MLVNVLMSLTYDYLTREEWIARYDTEKTRENARMSLRSLDKYLQSKSINESDLFEELRKTEPYRFLDSFVQFLKPDKDPSTIQNYFTFVRSWLRAQGVKTENYEIKQNIKFPKKIRELKQPLTYEIIKQLLNHCSDTYKALYVVLLSSGMRIGECLALQVQDVDMSKNPVVVHIKAENTKTREERFTFVSVEAKMFLRMIIKDKKPTDRIFEMVYSSVANQMYDLRERAKLNEVYSNGVHKITVHSFRSFFRTKAGFVNRDFAEKILGHRGYLGQYVRPDIEELSKEYLKIEPLVTINREKHLEVENQKLREKMNDVSDLKQKVARLEAALYAKKIKVSQSSH